MKNGSIGVKTENIFPVIKKFLYSENEIFLREIISNAVDATLKLKTLATAGEFNGEIGDTTIKVKIDKDKKTLTISDRGIGMTSEEVDKYINQIAFSGAEDFINKFKDKGDSANIIGHFGLGFYSSFMVSDKVSLISKSCRQNPDEQGVIWECDGNPEYTMTEIPKGDRGTDVILYISDDCADFLDEGKIRGLLEKYCKFMPVPVQFGTKKVEEPVEDEKTADKDDKDKKTKTVEKPWIINETAPLWKKTPSSIEEKEYDDFYHVLYPMNFDTPLFHIHLNVEYPFNLTGILYFPKIKNKYEFQRNKIQLYCNEVFVTDSVEGILPEFLTLLHGVVDSPDIPLNVSRSFLQNDQDVKKISGYITKKVAEKLEEMFKNDRADFEKKWDDIKVFIEYGMITDEKFWERAEKFALLKDTDGKYYTIEEYRKSIEEKQTDKNKRVIYLYATDTDTQYPNIENAKSHGYNVLMMDGILDTHFISNFEQKNENTGFARVDSDSISKLIEKDDDKKESKLDDKQKELIKKTFEDVIDKSRFTVVISQTGENTTPVELTQSEWMRRMKDMSVMGGGMSMWGDMPENYNILVNEDNSIISGLIDKDEETRKKTATQLYDLARLSKGLLKGKELDDFIRRSLEKLV